LNIRRPGEQFELRAENEQLQSSAKPLTDLVTKKSNDYMTDDNIIDKTKYLANYFSFIF
jgi:hypothetical protein